MRRIPPALVVTLLVGALMLGPGKISELASSAAATTLFGSNFYF